jgi:hypothetical protein
MDEGIIFETLMFIAPNIHKEYDYYFLSSSNVSRMSENGDCITQN